MRLHEILLLEAELNVDFREDGVEVSYGNSATLIYKAEASGDGIVFAPVSPWGGEPFFTDSHNPQAAWNMVKDKIRQEVIQQFSSVSRRARRTGKRIGMIR